MLLNLIPAVARLLSLVCKVAAARDFEALVRGHRVSSNALSVQLEGFLRRLDCFQKDLLEEAVDFRFFMEWLGIGSQSQST